MQYFSPPPRNFPDFSSPQLMTPQNNISNAPYLRANPNGPRTFNQEYQSELFSRQQHFNPPSPQRHENFNPPPRRQEFPTPGQYQFYPSNPLPPREDVYRQPNNLRESSSYLNQTLKRGPSFEYNRNPPLQPNGYIPNRRNFQPINPNIDPIQRFQEIPPPYQPFKNEFKKSMQPPPFPPHHLPQQPFPPRETPLPNQPLIERRMSPDFYQSPKPLEMNFNFENQRPRSVNPPFSSTLPVNDDYLPKPSPPYGIRDDYLLKPRGYPPLPTNDDFLPKPNRLNPYGIRDDLLLKPIPSRDYEDLMPFSSKLKPKFEVPLREMPPPFIAPTPKLLLEDPTVNLPHRFIPSILQEDFLPRPMGPINISSHFPVREFSFQPTFPLKSSHVEEPKKVHLDKDYDEIADALKEMIFFERNVQQSKEAVCRRPDFKIIRLIKEFDDNETGQIVFMEFKNGLKKFGVKADDGDIMLIFNRYSRDGDKKLEYELAKLLKFPIF